MKNRFLTQVAVNGKRYVISFPYGKGGLSKGNHKHLCQFIARNSDTVEGIASYAFKDTVIYLEEVK